MLTQTLSVVVPVYRAGAGLQETVRELISTAAAFALAPQVDLHLDEIILVVDNPSLPVAERAAVSALEEVDSRVRTVWLARNFGQHPATVAGIVSTNGDWVVTMDEDGQHDPREIPEMLLVATRSDVPLVYAADERTAPRRGAQRRLPGDQAAVPGAVQQQGRLPQLPPDRGVDRPLGLRLHR